MFRSRKVSHNTLGHRPFRKTHSSPEKFPRSPEVSRFCWKEQQMGGGGGVVGKLARMFSTSVLCKIFFRWWKLCRIFSFGETTCFLQEILFNPRPLSVQNIIFISPTQPCRIFIFRTLHFLLCLRYPIVCPIVSRVRHRLRLLCGKGWGYLKVILAFRSAL